jgi:importin subunit beta-1
MMNQQFLMDMNRLILILEHTLSPQQVLLDTAYRYLEAMARSEDSFAWLAAALASLAVGWGGGTTLKTMSADVVAALSQQAAIQLKNLVRHEEGARWLQLEPYQRNQIKAVLLGGLFRLECDDDNPCSMGDSRCRRGSGGSGLPQCIQAVAELELPLGTWPELIPQLVSAVVGGGGGPTPSAPLLAASLETLGFVCETVKPAACLEAQINQLLTALVYGMKETLFPAPVTLRAVKGLTQALELATTNMARLAERNYIMQV